jgi:hypothetical protein
MPKFVPSLGVSKFTELTDAPQSYSGQSKKVPAVKTTEDGLEFKTPYEVYNVVVASNNLRNSNDPEKGTSNTSPTKVKETRIDGVGGTLRIFFHLRASVNAGSNIAFAQIYRNGVAVGTQRGVATQSGGDFSQDISGWSPGDLIQIYAWAASPFTAFVSYFEIYCDPDIAYINKIGDYPLDSANYLKTTIQGNLPTFTNTLV